MHDILRPRSNARTAGPPDRDRPARGRPTGPADLAEGADLLPGGLQIVVPSERLCARWRPR